MNLNELPDRELDVKIAQDVFGIKKIFKPSEFKSANDAFWGSEEPSFIPSGKSPRTHMIDARPVPYFSSQIEAAMQVEDRIVELGKQTDYVFALGEIIEREKDSPAGVFDYAHATPRQRCLAALSAIAANQDTPK